MLEEEQWAAETRRNMAAGLVRAHQCVLMTEEQKLQSPHCHLTLCEKCALSTLKELEKKDFNVYSMNK